jgi:hydroxymethylbilane synthase
MPAPERILRLGTRGSLLAIAQSRLVAKALTEKNPGLNVKLIPVNTRGDRNQEIPLSEVRDAQFFSAELDDALIAGEVDLCVHSLKDLGSSRPDSIVRAAIPNRENPRDVIVFRPTVIDRLKQGQRIRIGSSSARRQFNVANFLRGALPNFGSRPRLQFTPIRGPVDQRLAHIHRHPDEADALDGVVLAIAGLARLWGDADAQRAIEPLLTGVRWMILPLSRCPAAPGQGALAVECRQGDRRTRKLLKTIHDPVSADLVQKELDVLSAIPESQRSGVGATALAQKSIGTLMFVRGGHSDSEGMEWQRPPRPLGSRSWDGGELQKIVRRHALPIDSTADHPPAMFVAHWHAITDAVSIARNTRIWVSGVRSWQKLARRGIWVEGCADNLGFADILPTLDCEVLQLPKLHHWLVLTHSKAIQSWRGTGVGQVQATYSVDPVTNIDDLPDLRRKITDATHFFWGSIDQYLSVKKWIPADAQHACGAGKTAQALQETGLVSLQLFPSRKEWQAWLR